MNSGTASMSETNISVCYKIQIRFFMSADTLPVPSNNTEDLINEFKESMRNESTTIPINDAQPNTEKLNKYSLKNLSEEDIKKLIEDVDKL